MPSATACTQSKLLSLCNHLCISPAQVCTLMQSMLSNIPLNSTLGEMPAIPASKFWPASPPCSAVNFLLTRCTLQLAVLALARGVDFDEAWTLEDSTIRHWNTISLVCARHQQDSLHAISLVVHQLLEAGVAPGKPDSSTHLQTVTTIFTDTSETHQ